MNTTDGNFFLLLIFVIVSSIIVDFSDIQNFLIFTNLIPIMVDNYAAFFNCTPVGRTSDSMMAPT